MSKKLDVNDMGPEARRALLNFVGGFLDLEALLISKGATKDDIRAGALEAINTIMDEDPKRKKKVLESFKRFNRGGL